MFELILICVVPPGTTICPVCDGQIVSGMGSLGCADCGADIFINEWIEEEEKPQCSSES